MDVRNSKYFKMKDIIILDSLSCDPVKFERFKEFGHTDGYYGMIILKNKATILKVNGKLFKEKLYGVREAKKALALKVINTKWLKARRL